MSCMRTDAYKIYMYYKYYKYYKYGITLTNTRICATLKLHIHICVSGAEVGGM
jgi:hypothetical protein